MIYLPQQCINPPIHRNSVAKISQYPSQQERFKQYVYMNSIPTGKQERGKSHYLIPSIRRIKTPREHEEPVSAQEAACYEVRANESLASKFNLSLDCLDEPIPHVSAETIRQWFRDLFPRYGRSPLQSDYCNHCAELKQLFESA